MYCDSALMSEMFSPLRDSVTINGRLWWRRN